MRQTKVMNFQLQKTLVSDRSKIIGVAASSMKASTVTARMKQLITWSSSMMVMILSGCIGAMITASCSLSENGDGKSWEDQSSARSVSVQEQCRQSLTRLTVLLALSRVVEKKKRTMSVNHAQTTTI